MPLKKIIPATLVLLALTTESGFAQSTEKTGDCTGKNTPAFDWQAKQVLWLGTSIPYQGIHNKTSYPEIFCQDLGCHVTNNAFPGSHMRWLEHDTDETCTSGKNAPRGLSATNRELHEKMTAALPDYGWSSYNASCQKLASPMEMGFEYRIDTAWQERSFDVVVIDHGHNDRRVNKRPSPIHDPDALGALNPVPMEISSIKTGKETRLILRAPHSLSIHDDISLRIPASPRLDYWTGEISAIDKEGITIELDSSDIPSISGGTLYRYDKSKFFDAYNLIISHIHHMSAAREKGPALILLMTPPTAWSGGTNNGSIAAVNNAIRLVAKKWAIPVYDMTEDLGIDDSNLTDFLPDLIHPTKTETRRFIARHIAEWARHREFLFDPCKHTWLAREIHTQAHQRVCFHQAPE